MQAILYVDTFLKRNRKVEACTLRLVGIAAIIIAVKMNEDKLLSMRQASHECDSLYDVDMLQKTEKIILVQLDFKLNLPTPLDFLQFFLYVSDSSFDFSEIISECMNFAYVGLMGK